MHNWRHSTVVCRIFAYSALKFLRFGMDQMKQIDTSFGNWTGFSGCLARIYIATAVKKFLYLSMDKLCTPSHKSLCSCARMKRGQLNSRSIWLSPKCRSEFCNVIYSKRILRWLMLDKTVSWLASGRSTISICRVSSNRRSAEERGCFVVRNRRHKARQVSWDDYILIRIDIWKPTRNKNNKFHMEKWWNSFRFSS